MVNKVIQFVWWRKNEKLAYYNEGIEFIKVDNQTLAVGSLKS